MSSKRASREFAAVSLEHVVLDGLGDVLYQILPRGAYSKLLGGRPRLQYFRRGAKLVERVTELRTRARELVLRPAGIRPFTADATPELQACFRRMLRVQLLVRSDDLPQVWSQFAPVFKLFDPGTDSHQGIFDYFGRIVTGFERMLIAEGVYRSRGARQYAETQEPGTGDELATIANSIDADHLGKIINFERTYRAKFNAAKAMVKPPDFYETRLVPIDQIYVPPTVLAHVEDVRQVPRWPYESIVRAIHRTVLLGTPGGGKSTFAQKTFHSISAANVPRLIAYRHATPFLVTLREFGGRRRRGGQVSLLEFMRAATADEHELQIPRLAVEYLIASGRGAVAFDGLDELLDTSFRQEVTAEVESFSARYKDTPVLVTSREVGYDEAPLGREFEVYKLAPFDEDQVRQYARKWFGLPGKSKNTAERDAEAFVTDTSIAPDLRSNPLMLGLMSNIYRGEGYIPRNRPEVFQKCAEMLFEKWDKSRGLNAPASIADDLRFAVNFLAFWIYGDESLQSGVTETDIVSKAAEYLTTWRFDSSETASRVAQQLVEYCTGRAWVFMDVGTTKDGLRLFQFAHRTFLEYFAASHVVRLHPTPSSLVRILRPRIRRGEWDVVAQLAVQIANKNVQGAGDDVLTALLAHARKDVSAGKWKVLSFLVRSLGFMVVHNSTVKAVVEATLVELLALPVEEGSPDDAFDLVLHDSESGTRRAGEVFGELLGLKTDAAPLVRQTLERVLDETLTGGAPHELKNAMQLLSVCRWRWSVGEAEGDAAYNSMTDRLFSKHSRRLADAARTDFFSAYELMARDALSLQKFVRLSGVSALFRPQVFTLFPIANFPVGALLVRQCAGLSAVPFRAEELEELLAWIAEKLAKVGPPWISYHNYAKLFDWFSEGADVPSGGEAPTLSPAALFGAFLLYATFVELEMASSNIIRRNAYREREVPLLRTFGEFAAARCDDNLPLLATATVSTRFGWDQQQVMLVQRWMRGEVSFASEHCVAGDKKAVRRARNLAGAQRSRART